MNASLDSDQPSFQIAPMVDVVFVLLLFFMACAAMKMTERNLPAGPPSHSTNPLPVTLTVLEITADGDVLLNGQPQGAAADVELEKLRAFLVQARQTYGQDPVLIRPASAARHERVMQVLSCLHRAGVKQINFG
jgi:biopolymer transport protein ExbD